MSLCARSARAGSGITGSDRGRKDQKLRSAAVTPRRGIASGASTSAHSAPAWIQSMMSWISASGSGSASRGIWRSSLTWRSAAMMRLSSALPGMIAGPRSPPWSMRSRESSLRPLRSSSVWHEKQLRSSTGRTLSTKRRAPGDRPSSARARTAARCPPPAVPAPSAASATSGQGAPMRTHSMSPSICRGVSGSASRGISWSSISWRTVWMSRLPSGSPGMIAGPDAPPARRASRELTRSLPRRSWPWHSKQLSASTGRTRVSKNSSGVCAGAGSEKSSGTAARSGRRDQGLGFIARGSRPSGRCPSDTREMRPSHTCLMKPDSSLK